MLIATYGKSPGDGVDTSILRNTFTEVLKPWYFDRGWGWDFPVFAMTAARLNMPEKEIDMLLSKNKHNTYITPSFFSWVYLPRNGRLLSSIVMMEGGRNDGFNTYTPGFPKNGKYKVKVVGFGKML